MIVRITVDGNFRGEPVVSTLRELRLATVGPSWHLVTLDTGRLPVIDGRTRGLRVVAYALP